MSLDAAVHQPAPAAAPRLHWWHSVRHVLGVLILSLWAVVTAVNIWMIPHQATGSDLESALEAGTVTGWAFVGHDTSTPAMGSSAWDLGITRQQHRTAGATYLVWQTNDLRRHTTDLAALTQHAGSGYNDVATGIDAWLINSFDRHHADVPFGTADGPEWLNWVTIGLGLVGLAAILGGPEPQIGSRWFWFWLLGATIGLGLFAYAILECLRDGRPLRRRPAQRLGGWHGVLLLVVGSWLVTGVTGLFI